MLLTRSGVVLDEPTGLPEGPLTEPAIAEPEDEPDHEERAALQQALARSRQSAPAG